MGLGEEAGKALTITVDAMKASPLAIALLIVNLGFMVLLGWVLHEIGVISKERNDQQGEMINTLISTFKECKMGATSDLKFPALPVTFSKDIP
jgi:hypothetical protein